ncbi:MAG: branched-chain-amino-acid transaminase [bacterium]|nr:branched-chain-amino-acid transaminase [bacterium]
MSLSEKIWFDGKIVDKADANAFFFNQALNFGASVFDGIRIYDTKNGPCLFRIDDHIDRFFYSLHALRMKSGFSKEDLKRAVIEIAKENKITSGYVRPLSFYSEPKMGINILDSKVSTAILTWPWDDGSRQKPVTVKISKYKRLSPESADLRAKIGGYYAPGILAFIDAREAGYDLPMMLDENGNIAEGAVSNFFFVKDGKLYVPRADKILEGITSSTIVSLAEDLGIEVILADFSPEDLKSAEEAFFTSTGAKLQQIERIESFFTSKGFEVTEKIQGYFEQVVGGEVEKYTKWLTPVV